MSEPTNRLPATVVASILREVANAIDLGYSRVQVERSLAQFIYYEQRTIHLPQRRAVPSVKSAIKVFESDTVRPLGVTKVIEAVHPITGQKIKGVPVRYMRRFAKLLRPTRVQWNGDRVMYARCRRLFSEYGFVLKHGRKLFWDNGFTLDDRVAFADQFDTKAKEVKA